MSTSKRIINCKSILIHNLSKLQIYQRYSNTSSSRFTNIPELGMSRGSKDDDINRETAIERELLNLERDDKIEIDKDPRTEADFPEIRVMGPRSKNTKYKSKTQNTTSNKPVYNRAGIEKPHAYWGWSPQNDRTAQQYNWKDNNRANKDIPDSEKQTWPNALTLLNDASSSSRNKYYNPNDLTTFESYSESSRSATYKCALNVGVHWGKEKSLWHPSMGPYLKGVVDGRHIFDLTLTISNLRKIIRLLQSMIMDECNILFVCNAKDIEMRTLARIMCTRCNMPLLDDKWSAGALTNWNHMAQHYRGPGRELLDGKKPKFSIWRKSKLHRLIREPPDFIFLFNRSDDSNDILVHEANRMQIPVASLCDSDDSTRDLQYVIPCNTQSIQSVHFILDMISRGILEAQAKMDSIWWSKQKDLEIDRNALYDAEIEWQYKYDPYQQQRHSHRMMAGDQEDELDIATSYIKEDEDVLETFESGTVQQPLILAKYGNVHADNNYNLKKEHGAGANVSDFGATDAAEQSRQDKLKTVLDNRSSEYERRFKENQEKENPNEAYVKKFELHKTFQTTSDFAMSMLQDHVTNQVKYRQRLTSMTSSKKRDD